MSSPPTTPTVSSASSTTSSTSSASPSQSSDGNGGPSSSLYLFTFLATLFLLLFVSSAIILRSFILRRRFRRRIEEAILAGVIPPPQTGRVNRRRVIGEKPKLWEARVYPASNDRWDSIIPVSAQSTLSGQHATTTLTANMTGGERQPAATVSAPLSPPTQDPSRPPLYRRPWLRNLFSWRRGSSSSSPMNPLPTSEPFEDSRSLGLQGQNPTSPSMQDRLRVTVLVAMPDPRRPHADGGAGQSKGKERTLDSDYDEDDLPEMALGLTELQYKDNATITTPKLS
ncbi:hypothetical protein F5888DRAFT_1801538 [Russula emetica]|nr:hypothetical protein F5888DRAFT_1801538 [Russula emetica]